MIKISHRINTIEALSKLDKNFGAEIDVRYHEDELILAHDPFGHHKKKDMLFSDFLAQYHLSGPLILNIKTEGIEEKCISLMNAHSITNWFFLDLSMPYFVKYALLAKGKEISGFSDQNLAVRFSEFEPIEYALSFKGMARWVWVDCFSKMPLNSEIASKFKQAGFQICLVSPELQKHDISRILEFREEVKSMDIDAVCTKRPDLW